LQNIGNFLYQRVNGAVVGVEYASSPAGDALADFNCCCDAGSESDKAELFHLIFDYLENDLRRKSPPKLEAYLASRSVWHSHNAVSVYKTTGLPSCAYTAFDYEGEFVVLVLGFCINYPGTEHDWWSQTIQPRLIEHL
jgi:hypothetical protein